MEGTERLFEIKLPTRYSRNTKIRITADNHLLALKLAVRALKPDVPMLEVRRVDYKWQLLSLNGDRIGYIKELAPWERKRHEQEHERNGLL